MSAGRLHFEERNVMRATIRCAVMCGSLILVLLAGGCDAAGLRITCAAADIPGAGMPATEEEIVYLTDDGSKTDGVHPEEERNEDLNEGLIDPAGTTLETRFQTPKGYHRVAKEMGSFQGFLRRYDMKPDKSPVLLYDGSRKRNQEAHAAVFAMPVFDSDLQQCADSIIRIYADYFWKMGDYSRIAFHLTNGFMMDYSSWRDGKRLLVQGNDVSWVQKAGYDDSYETFLKYVRNVMVYAGTLSLSEEGTPIDAGSIQAGDMFIRGGSPGHCVMVADVAEDEAGNRCFLLAQGYMPAQEFQILKNPLHEEDPWYYTSELEYPLTTPEYVFPEGSLKRWYGFVY